MFLTVHASAGIIIGQQTGNIWLAFLAGIISHIIFDIIPHGDQVLLESNEIFKPEEIKTVRKLASFDILIMMALLSAIYLSGQLTPMQEWPVLFAVFGAILPDFISGLYILYNVTWLRWQFVFQYRLHYIFGGFTINFRQGKIVQAIILIILIALIIIG